MTLEQRLQARFGFVGREARSGHHVADGGIALETAKRGHDVVLVVSECELRHGMSAACSGSRCLIGTTLEG